MADEGSFSEVFPEPSALVEALGGAPDLPPEVEIADQHSDPSAPLPEHDNLPALELDEEQKLEITQSLEEMLCEHDGAMEPRWKTLDTIADAYELKVNRETTGLQPNAAQASSEITKSFCDQSSARISNMMINTEPLIRVEPAGEGEGTLPEQLAEEFAKSIGEFTERYAKHTIKTRKMIPKKIDRASMFGDGITRDMWEVSHRTHRWIGQDGKLHEEEQDYGRIVTRFIDYRQFILWPVAIDDWQEQYEMAGHRAKHSKWKFIEICESFKLDKATIEEMTGEASSSFAEDSDDEDTHLRRHDVRAGGTDLLASRYQLTEIWYDGAPADLEAGKYQFILHEATNTLIYAGNNPLNSGKHPYFPFSYKRSPRFGFGNGVGAEVAPFQKADSSLINLEIDNAKVIGNNIILVKEDTGADTFHNHLYPGRRVITENPKEDLVSVALGAPIEMIHEMQDRQKVRAMSSSGLPNVLQGTGDIVMKSGADVGSVGMLIEEAGKKFGGIDDGIKQQFEEEVVFWIELFQQFAPNGLFYRHVSEEVAVKLQMLKFVPPRFRFEDELRVVVQAPSAAANKTLRRQLLMIMLQIAEGHLNQIERLGQEILEIEGMPNMVADLKRQIFTFRNQLFRQLIEIHDTASLKDEIPKLAEPQQADQIIAQMYDQLKQVNAQVEQLSAQNQALQYQAQGADPALAANVSGAGALPTPLAGGLDGSA